MMSEKELERSLQWHQKIASLFEIASEDAIIEIANAIVMGWLPITGDYYEVDPQDGREMKAAADFRWTFLTMSYQKPEVAKKVMKMLEEDKGGIITPQFKEEVLEGARKLLQPQ